MQPLRLSAAQVDEHLADASSAVRKLALQMRRVVLKCVPEASEGLRFGALCYFHPDVPFGAIGGNICMIEIRDAAVRLSFIQGVDVPDPCHLLRGTGKAKRFVLIEDAGAAADPRIVALVRAASDVSGSVGSAKPGHRQ